ncbi:unnamed protein product [Meloidogyne enterolobii]|uniref:Uncharacterized protein n=1 Tax=Meloidogyne enterolobii TaxID=390850 RepID=A0ACB0YMM8_MELEN
MVNSYAFLSWFLYLPGMDSVICSVVSWPPFSSPVRSCFLDNSQTFSFLPSQLPFYSLPTNNQKGIKFH